MNQEQYLQQARHLLVVMTLLAKAVDLTTTKVDKLYSKAGYNMDQEMKFYGKNIGDSLQKILRNTRYIEEIVLSHGKTFEGKTDGISVGDAWTRDAYKVARFACYLFNINVDEDEVLKKAEEFLVSLPREQYIRPDIIENLRLNEDKRTDTTGSTEA